MIILLSDAAKGELEQAINWYNDQVPNLGRRFALEVDRSVKRMAKYPGFHPEITPGIYRGLVKVFPYGIIYSFDQSGIKIIAIAHLHRYPNYWKSRDA